MKVAHLPVGHCTYRLEFVKKKPVVDGEVCQGVCDYKQRKITIWENPNVVAMRSCMVHEFLHALFYELGHEELADDHSMIVALEMAIMRLRLEIPSL